MGCSCHGTSRKAADVTRPLDQCAVCAKKHFDDAFGCWSEFLYTEANRDHIHRQLRAAVNHTFRAYPDLARKIRDLAQKILFAQDDDSMPEEWQRIQEEINHNFYEAAPEAEARLAALAENRQT